MLAATDESFFSPGGCKERELACGLGAGKVPFSSWVHTDGEDF